MRVFKGSFRKPTEADIEFLVEHMREADRREIKRMSAQNIEWSVRHSVECSDACYTGVLEDGSIACIFGAMRGSLVDGSAVLWELSTDAVDRHPVEFAVGSKAGLDLLCREMDDVGEFGNWVDLDYRAAIRWIEWFGGSFASRELRPGLGGSKFGFFYFPNPHHKED